MPRVWESWFAALVLERGLLDPAALAAVLARQAQEQPPGALDAMLVEAGILDLR
jgi:hypothetical protein